MKREYACAQRNTNKGGRCEECYGCEAILAALERAFAAGETPGMFATTVGCDRMTAKKFWKRRADGRPLLGERHEETPEPRFDDSSMSVACGLCGLRGAHECIGSPGTGLGRWEWVL